MSLIRDALREAQRERSERSGQPGVSPAVDNFFPYPTGESERGPKVVRVAIAGSVIVVIALVAWWSTSHVFTRGNAAAPAVARRVLPSPRTQVATVAPTPSQTAAPAASVAAQEADSATVRPRTAPATTSRASAPIEHVAGAPTRDAASPKPTVYAAASAPTTTKQVAAVDSSAMLASSAAVQPSLATSVSAPSAGSHGVKIIVDGESSRPADSVFKLAYAEHVRGNFDRAKELYEQTIAMQQASSEAYNDYGVLLSQHGNPTAAGEMFRIAVRRDDANLEAWINLGDSYNLAGHHADAMSAFSRALQLDPGNVSVKTRLADEYASIGDSSSARRLFEESLKAAPDDPAVHYAVGKFLQSQQDLRGAVREFQRFVSLASGKFDAKTIDAVKQHVAVLERSAK